MKNNKKMIKKPQQKNSSFPFIFFRKTSVLRSQYQKSAKLLTSYRALCPILPASKGIACAKAKFAFCS